MLKKRGQVWVETVIYVLIGLTIIAILIALITPRVKEMNDKAIVEQSINSLSSVDEKIYATLMSPSSQREIDLYFRKGEYIINSEDNTISFSLKGTNLLYSQLNKTVRQGEIYILTSGKKDNYDIMLTLNYSSFNVTFNGRDENKVLTASSTGYRLLVRNNGKVGDYTQININII